MEERTKALDLFLNIALMHGFRNVDEKLMDYFQGKYEGDIDEFDAAYQYLLHDVQKYIPASEA